VLKFPEYVETFYKSGWDGFDVLHDINDNELISMNIQKKGHRQRILNSIQQLVNFFF